MDSICLPLPRMSGDAARLANAVSAAAGPAQIRLGTVTIGLRLGGAVAQRDGLRVCVQLGPDLLAISCPGATLASLLQVLETNLTLDECTSPPLLGLLLDTLLDPFLSGWQQMLGCDIKLSTIDPICALASPAVAIELALPDGTLHLVSLTGTAAICRLLNAWPAKPRDLTELRLPLWAYLGSAELPLEVIATLRVGDAVVLEPHHQPSVHVGSGWGAAARKRENGFMLTERPATLPISAGPYAMSASKDANIEALPVRLDFMIGHQDIALSELRKLQPGSVVSLGRCAAELVEIQVNNRRVGKGELVEVNGVVAVRIVSLFGLD